MPEAVVADLMKALGQDVLAEAAQELMARHAAGAPLAGFAVLVAEVGIEGLEPAVGESSAEDITGEIVEHTALTLSPRRAMHG